MRFRSFLEGTWIPVWAVAMAIVSAILVLCAAALFMILAAGMGPKLLRLGGLAFSRAAVHLLASVACGVIALEILFFLGADDRIHTFVHCRDAGPVGCDLPGKYTSFTRKLLAYQHVWSQTGAEHCAVATLVVLGLKGLCAMAPLIGPDVTH